jgi:hypothetical protein
MKMSIARFSFLLTLILLVLNVNLFAQINIGGIP